MANNNSTEKTMDAVAQAAWTRIQQRAAELAATTTGSSRTKSPRACACGCGGTTRGGTWLPGHDAKALSRALVAERTAAASK